MNFVTSHWLMCRDKIENLYNNSSDSEQLLLRISNYDDILVKVGLCIKQLENTLNLSIGSMDLYQSVKVIINSIKFVVADIDEGFENKNSYTEH